MRAIYFLGQIQKRFSDSKKKCALNFGITIKYYEVSYLSNDCNSIFRNKNHDILLSQCMKGRSN